MQSEPYRPGELDWTQILINLPRPLTYLPSMTQFQSVADLASPQHPLPLERPSGGTDHKGACCVQSPFYVLYLPSRSLVRSLRSEKHSSCSSHSVPGNVPLDECNPNCLRSPILRVSPLGLQIFTHGASSTRAEQYTRPLPI